MDELFLHWQRASEAAVGGSQELKSFQMILEYIKALPVSISF